MLITFSTYTVCVKKMHSLLSRAVTWLLFSLLLLAYINLFYCCACIIRIITWQSSVPWLRLPVEKKLKFNSSNFFLQRELYFVDMQIVNDMLYIWPRLGSGQEPEVASYCIWQHRPIASQTRAWYFSVTEAVSLEKFHISLSGEI